MLYSDFAETNNGGDVIFNGKRMSRCPKGYTTCSRLNSGAMLKDCIPTSLCERKIADKKKASSQTEPERIKEKGIEEGKNKEEIQSKKIEEAKDFIFILKQGILLDPDTGKSIGIINKKDPGTVLRVLKKFSRVYSPDILKQISEGFEILNYLKVLESPSLRNQTEKSTGIVEKLLANLGIGIKFE